MADILKVTTPAGGGYDNNNNVRANPITTNDTNIQNVVDPSKVTRTDGHEGENNAKNNTGNNFALNYDSNFGKFIQGLRNSPTLSSIIPEMIFSGMGMIISSGINENFADEISQFMNMLNMTEEELLEFLKNQSSSSVKFQGSFFNMLKSAFDSTNSIDSKIDILNFLKTYNDFSAGKHILNNIMQTLKDMKDYMPSNYRAALIELTNKLNAYAQKGDNAQNVKILKNEILPFLSKYISKTHDMGKARDFITFLTVNIARYENSGKDKFIFDFRALLNNKAIQEKLGNLDTRQTRMLETALINNDNNKGTELIDKFISLIQRGISGEGGYESKAVFENIVNSLLINQSVYMPILHMIIPAQVNGTPMFSEIWADPDSEGNGGSEEERSTKLFIKFDIKGVGFFDLIINSKNNVLDIQLYYPEKLMYMENEIKNAVKGIAQTNGFTFKNLLVEKCIRPKTISEVFPKIYERKNTINVTI